MTCRIVACSWVSRSASAARSSASALTSYDVGIRPARISAISSTSSYVGGALALRAPAARSPRSRPARSSWSSRSCSAQRGQSGAAKSSANSEYGVTTPCAQATSPAAAPARVALDVAARSAYFVVARLVDRVDRACPGRGA